MKTTSLRRMLPAAAFAAISIGAMAPVLAQEDTYDPRLGTIEEIITTATKREENVQDVAAAITALDGESLMRAGIEDPTRLGLVVPGMQFGYSGNEARVAMRGARTNNVGAEAEQVVGIFEDGLYVPSTTAAFGHYLDLARIEVLRGPQGTLYGRNTFAGTINIITNEPNMDAIEGSVSGLIGDYNRTRFDGVLNVPVSDQFALRFAALSDRRDGYIENSWIQGPSDDYHDLNVQIGRVSAKWEPNDRFSGIFRYTINDKESNGSAIWGYTQIGCYRNDLDATTSTGLAATATYFDGHCYQPGPNASGRTDPGGEATEQDAGPWNISRDTPAKADTKSSTANVQLQYDFDAVSLKFIGALSNFESLQYYDVDYSNGRFDGFDSFNNGFAGYDSDQDSYSTELQLLSNNSENLEWILGFYYFDSENDWQFGFMSDGVYTRYSPDSTDRFETSTTAFFGQATYTLGDTMRITGGLRWNEDEKALLGASEGNKWDKVLYKVGLEFDVGSDAMLFATTSTGFRTGGVNGSTLVAAGAPPVYDPEEVTAYEIGAKTTLLGGELMFNVNAFYNDYTDMHAQSFVVACIDPNDLTTCIASEFTENGGEIEAYGLEVEASWLPGDNWFLNGTLSLMQSEFGEYNVGRQSGLGNFEGRQDVTRTAAELDAAGESILLSYKGWTPALNPEVSGSLQVGYAFELANGDYITPMVQTAFSGDYYSFDINEPNARQSSHTRTDLRLTWYNAERGLEIQAFVLNVEDEAVLTRSVFFGPGQADVPTTSIQANYSDPRTWGVQVSLDF